MQAIEGYPVDIGEHHTMAHVRTCRLIESAGFHLASTTLSVLGAFVVGR